MASKKRSRNSGNRRNIRPVRLGRFRLKTFGWALLFTVATGGVGFLWYSFQDRPTQIKAEGYLLDFLDWGRENRHLPYEFRFILDVVADQVPLNIGHTVDPGELRGDHSILYGGAPESRSSLRILKNEGYLVGYNEQLRNPAWVAYRVFKNNADIPSPRPENFNVDTRTRARVEPHEYSNSGYDRGHMAPNLAISLLYGEKAQEETFLMSNILPQSPDLNRKVWRDLESSILRRYARRFGEVWVITGPVYSQGKPKTIGRGVAIPDACFKILVDEHEKGLRAIAFLIPQNVSGDENPAQFLTSIRDIEQKTGLNFFPNLPKDAQESLETWVSPRLW